VRPDGSAHLGNIHSYFISRYDFSEGKSLISTNIDCVIIPFTGDNPATIASLPLAPMDCIVSLGTSTTLLLTTKKYQPSAAYHIFNHPTTKDLYFAMLCYKNGSLAREQIRDKINGDESCEWEKFNTILKETPILGGPAKLVGFYFPLPEIIPDAHSGTWRYEMNAKNDDLSSWTSEKDVRAIVESQALSMRLRAHGLLAGEKPRHLYFVGGASRNEAIVDVMAQVLGSQEGVFRLTEGVTAGACARGSAIKAAWAYDGRGVNFEDFVRIRWNTESRLEKMDVGNNPKIWDEYGDILEDYRHYEDKILREVE
jgi:xylulokinase